jgi:hypothetical protein
MRLRRAFWVFGLAVWLSHGVTIELGCGSNDAKPGGNGGSSSSSGTSTSSSSGDGGSSADANLKAALAGKPTAETQKQAAVLQAALSSDEIAHLNAIIWEYETADQVLNDPTITHALSALISSGALASRAPTRLELGVAHADTCSAAAKAALQSGIQAAAAILAGSAPAGAAAAACGPAGLFCGTAVLALIAGATISQALDNSAAALKACLGTSAGQCGSGQVDLLCSWGDEGCAPSDAFCCPDVKGNKLWCQPWQGTCVSDGNGGMCCGAGAAGNPCAPPGG